MEKKLLPFDLDKALKGAKVVTRDGREASDFIPWEFCFTGKVGDKKCTWRPEGKFFSVRNEGHPELDLFLLDESESPKIESIVLPSKEEYQKFLRDHYEDKLGGCILKPEDIYNWFVEHIDKEWYKPGVQPTNIDEALAEYDYDEILETVPMDVIKDWVNSHEGSDESLQDENPDILTVSFDMEIALEHPEWVFTKSGIKIHNLNNYSLVNLLIGEYMADEEPYYASWDYKGKFQLHSPENDLILKIPRSKWNMPKK